MKLNESLLVVLAILMVIAVSCSAISAYSDDGSGSIDSNPGGNNYTDDSDVDPDIEYDSDNGGGSGGDSVSLSSHATGNPLILLLGAITLVGVSARIR